MNDRSHATYRGLSLGLALIFALVGAAFLILPQATLAFFNAASRRLGMAEGPTDRWFFSVLAVAYMYVVTVLAWLMYRSPREKIFPFLLAQAKLASSALSFLMFAVQGPWLIYLANGVVDAAIGILVLMMYFRVRSEGRGVAL